jgi:hypothetical protein
MNLLQKDFRQLISSEISRVARYFEKVTVVGEASSKKTLLEAYLKKACERSADIHFSGEPECLILDEIFNYSTNLDVVLGELYEQMERSSRAVLVLYNPYYRFAYQVANVLGIRKGPPPKNFMTRSNLDCLLKAAKFDLVHIEHPVFIPLVLGGVGEWVNRVLKSVPLLNQLSVVSLAYIRPIKTKQTSSSISIVVPARNEEGNIQRIVDSIPDFAPEIELIFVEGNSTDNTWKKILEVTSLPEVRERFSNIICCQQEGKGKADAVRKAFSLATADLLTILDADLTMPAEELPRFYQAYQAGHGDFINGNRLLYPMELEAMRFINHIGNIFFAKLLSLILSIRINDSLCGTKLFSRQDYQRIKQWNEDFGKFDPFGDYEMLFPASVLKLGIIDIPIVYRSRTYGDTNISRFKDSLKLLKMCAIGFLRIKL